MCVYICVCVAITFICIDCGRLSYVMSLMYRQTDIDR